MPVRADLVRRFHGQNNASRFAGLAALQRPPGVCRPFLFPTYEPSHSRTGIQVPPHPKKV